MKPFGNTIFLPTIVFILAFTFLHEALPAENNPEVKDALTVIHSRKSEIENIFLLTYEPKMSVYFKS